jgi:hypothetical protein
LQFSTFSPFQKAEIVNTMQGYLLVVALHFLARPFNVLAGTLPCVAAGQEKR